MYSGPLPTLMVGTEMTRLIQGYIIGRPLETTKAKRMQTISLPYPK